jgi:GTP:adenosylcobinamide-phosphate guanylyltransferase
MSTTLEAEASKPLKKMQECNKCKSAGFPNQMISFEKAGEDSYSGKVIWRLLDGNGQLHVHKSVGHIGSGLGNGNNNSPYPSLFKRRKLVDINTVTDLEEARKLIKSGWEYKTVFPATLENIPHYVLVKRE